MFFHRNFSNYQPLPFFAYRYYNPHYYYQPNLYVRPNIELIKKIVEYDSMRMSDWIEYKVRTEFYLRIKYPKHLEGIIKNNLNACVNESINTVLRQISPYLPKDLWSPGPSRKRWVEARDKARTVFWTCAQSKPNYETIKASRDKVEIDLLYRGFRYGIGQYEGPFKEIV